MEKMTYNIRTSKESTRQVSGYVFWYSGLRFGVHKTGGSGGWWNLTELSTGVCAYSAQTRQAAVHKLFCADFCKRVKTAVDIQQLKDVNPEINPKTEFLTVYA